VSVLPVSDELYEVRVPPNARCKPAGSLAGSVMSYASPPLVEARPRGRPECSAAAG
jgi:hypothetical protein